MLGSGDRHSIQSQCEPALVSGNTFYCSGYRHLGVIADSPLNTRQREDGLRTTALESARLVWPRARVRVLVHVARSCVCSGCLKRHLLHIHTRDPVRFNLNPVPVGTCSERLPRCHPHTEPCRDRGQAPTIMGFLDQTMNPRPPIIDRVQGYN